MTVEATPGAAAGTPTPAAGTPATTPPAGTGTPAAGAPTGGEGNGAPAGGESAKPVVAPATGKETELPAGDAGKEGGGIEYRDTGDAGLNMALKYVASHGFGPDHPAMAAAINGDFTLLRAELAGKNAPGFDAYMTLAENAFTKFDTENKAKREADTKAVHDIAGGEENWKAVTAWAKENASEEEQTVFNEMLKEGGVKAKIVAQYLSRAYGGSNTPATETDGPGAGVSAIGGRSGASTDALSPKEYGAAVQEARRNHRGGPFEASPAYRQLVERRARWKP
jgi:hypothetical protein